jgi:two-component system cell cycle sensor histidine kinase/response regulator CckA
MATEEITIQIPSGERKTASSLLYQGDPASHHVVDGPFLRAHDLQSTPPGKVKGASRTRQETRISIVEDEQDLLTVYLTFLEGLGYDWISTFLNGEDFVRAVSEGSAPPDVVIMDFRLPGKNGIEVAKLITALRPNVKVIITTADDSVRHEAKALGFSFLQKPFSLLQLLRTVEPV